MTYSILVNGEPTEFFKPIIGLRQGEPLSPYLFILCMEVISSNLSTAQNSKKIQGIKIARYAPSLSHLFFGDDALFFFKGIPKVCWNLKEIIGLFCEKSGEAIHYNKSTVIFSPNTPRTFKALMRKPLEVKSSESLGKYPRSPMDIDGRNTKALDSVIDRINSKILSWKFIHLSPSARLILINTILCTMASHIMAIYLLPKRISKRIDSTLLKYWWTPTAEKRPIYWRKRSVLELHKTGGGIGLKNTGSQNMALLAKQAWRIYNSKNSIISQLY